MNEKKRKRTYYEEIYLRLENGINNLKDLIELGYFYRDFMNFEYLDQVNIETNIDLDILLDIIYDLEDLDKLIGLDEIKQNIFQQVLYFLQDLNDKDDYLHTVIYGSPGVGKTTVIKILASIYKNMNILSKGFVKTATKDQLIAEYIGQTAIKTKNFLDSCLGGVMILDEAYQLSSGNLDKGDSFSKECIDIINQYLLEHRHDFIMILAGYKNDIEKCFFSLNQGLERRFPWRFEINDYEGDELQKIFYEQVEKIGWKIENDCIPKYFFNENKKYFKNNGGDTEILLNKIKIAHSYRIVNKSANVKKKINQKDFLQGFEMFKQTENIKSRVYEEKLPFMYI